MKTAEEIRNLILQGESTTVQFKVRIDDVYKIGMEMVAFCNTQGGMLMVGIDDKTGKIKGMSFAEIQATNALLANAASENVKPAIVIKTETVNVHGQNVIAVTIPQGKDKPYKDNKGIIWVKNGSDKRKVFSNSELRVMMQSCGNLSADKDSVEGTSYNDISEPILKTFLYKRYTEELTSAGIFSHLVQTTEIEDIVKAIDINFTVEKLLKNISLMDNAGQLTLSGLLLLGKSIQRYRPVFTIKCISFVGNSVATNEFRDKMPDREVEGNLLVQYNAAISFINRNLKTIQVEEEFNSAGQLEIPLEVFVETLTNALIHRNYYINAPVRLFIFDHRIEIHSPGILPDSVTEETIKQGISIPRNQLLFNNAIHILPYTGIGSGMVRAMQCYDKLFFKNNFVTEEFVITIMRKEIADDIVVTKIADVNDESADVNDENADVNDESADVNDEDADVNDENADVKLSSLQAKMIELIKLDGQISQKEIAKRLNVNRTTIYRNIEKLKKQGIIEHFGSDKTGGYRITGMSV